MHNKLRGFAAALLIAVLFVTLPAAAAARPSRTSRIVQAAKRLVDSLVPWLYSRISPPGGSPTGEEPPPTTEPQREPEKTTT